MKKLIIGVCMLIVLIVAALIILTLQYDFWPVIKAVSFAAIVLGWLVAAIVLCLKGA